MALTLKYAGGKAYTELSINGVRYGFARGVSRDDIPDWWIEQEILPAIANGTTMWIVTGATPKSQGKEMIKALQEAAKKSAPVAEPEPEPEPEPELEPEPEPEPVVEETTTITSSDLLPEVPEIVSESSSLTADDVTDEMLMEAGFSSGMTRAQMQNWCGSRGIPTINTDTKASLTGKARQFLAGASE